MSGQSRKEGVMERGRRGKESGLYLSITARVCGVPCTVDEAVLGTEERSSG